MKTVKKTKQQEYIDMVAELPNFKMEEYLHIKIITYTIQSNRNPEETLYGLVIFERNRPKPAHVYRFTTEKSRSYYITQWKGIYTGEYEREQLRLAQAKQTNEKIKEGTILDSSWGYDQTNINFYLVISRQGEYVTVQEIGKHKTYSKDYDDRGECTPDINYKIGEPFRRKLNTVGGIKINSVAYASIYDGKPLYWSDYH